MSGTQLSFNSREYIFTAFCQEQVMNTVFTEVVTLYCHSHLHDKMLHFFRSYRHCIVASYSVEFCQDFYLLFAHLHKQMKL